MFDWRYHATGLAIYSISVKAAVDSGLIDSFFSADHDRSRFSEQSRLAVRRAEARRAGGMKPGVKRSETPRNATINRISP